MQTTLFQALYKLITRSIIGISLSLGGFLFLQKIDFFGFRIPTSNLSLDYIKGVFWALSLLVATQFLPLPQKLRNRVSLVWAIKSFVALGLMLVYERKYVLDAYHYFLDASAPEFYGSFSLYDGTMFVGWMSWHIAHFLPGAYSYHALKVIWAFAGLIGVIYLYLTYANLSHKKNPNMIFALALVPSVLFWTTIFGKDPLAFLGISFFAYGVSSLEARKGRTALLYLILGSLFVSLIRFWLLPLLIGGLSVYGVFTLKRSLSRKFIYSIGLIGILSIVTSKVLEFIQINSFQEAIERINLISNAWARGGSAQEVPQFGSLLDLLLFLPKGAFAALFRPLPGEINNLFGVLAGFENLGVLIGFILVLKTVFIDRKGTGFHVFALGFVLLWSSLYAFISYQNLGTAFRFRLQVLPFLLLLFVLYFENRKINNSTTEIRKKLN